MSSGDLEFKRKTFFGVLREHSFCKEDPISEWAIVKDIEGDGSSTCICTTPILYEFVIENKLTKKQLVIGSECVKRWNIEFTCKSCGCHLGNITKRLIKKDYVCPACKRQQKKDEKARQEVKERYGNLRFFWYGPYYQKKFSDVIDDIDYVEKVLNHPKKNTTLELFERYVGMCYDIVTVPTE